MVISPVVWVAVPTATVPWVVPDDGESDVELEGDSEALGDLEAEGDKEADAELEGESDALGLKLAELEDEPDELGESDAEVDCDSESDAEGDSEADGDSDGEELPEGLVEADGDREAEGETEADVGSRLEVTQPKTRQRIGPVTVNNVPVPTAPLLVFTPSKVTVLTAWIDQPESVTLAPLAFVCREGIYFSFLFRTSLLIVS